MAQKLHTFRAETLDAAYRKMRQKLGEHAVVLRTTQVKEGGVFGLMGRKVIELTAAQDQPANRSVTRRPSTAERRYAATSQFGSDETVRETVTYFKELVTDAQRRMGIANFQSQSGTAPSRPTPAPATPPRPAPQMGSQQQEHTAAPTRPTGVAVGESSHPMPSPRPVIPFPKAKESHAESEGLRQELRELRNLVEVLIAEAPGAGLPPEFAPHYRGLVESGVSRPVAATLMGAIVKGSDLSVLRDEKKLVERLRQEVTSRIRCTNGIELKQGSPRVIALVGPTGVGKTTNVAKLAALYAVRQRARVALITTDTYRVAAPEQLRTYANIIGLPLQVANSPKEMTSALRMFRDQDLVLIDTAGGSPFNTKQMQELKEMLDAGQVRDRLLVLSATTPLEDLRAVVDKFSAVAPVALLFSKLDETQRYGAMFSILAGAELPVSFLSVGQNVPEDLWVAKPDAVASLIVKGGEKRGISSPKSA